VQAVYLAADEWVVGLGMSLVDFEFRVRLQACLLSHAGDLLRQGVSVVLEFGSWSQDEREAIRRVAVDAGAQTELHFLNGPLDELVRRVRARGGPDAETLASKVLLETSERFERPAAAEIARFDRYVGPDDEWAPG
jgi:predicted kinase